MTRQIDWDNLTEDDVEWLRNSNREHMVPDDWDTKHSQRVADSGKTSGDASGPATSVVEYNTMNNEALRAELEQRGLPTSGNKQELVARLQEHDATR